MIFIIIKNIFINPDHSSVFSFIVLYAFFLSVRVVFSSILRLTLNFFLIFKKVKCY
jgi:hypothetical protein